MFSLPTLFSKQDEFQKLELPTKTATSSKTIPHGALATSPERISVHRVKGSYFVEKSLLSPAIPEQPVLISWGTSCRAAHPLEFTANLVQNRLDQQGSHRDWTALQSSAGGGCFWPCTKLVQTWTSIFIFHFLVHNLAEVFKSLTNLQMP